MNDKPILYSDTFSLYSSPTGLTPRLVTMAELHYLVTVDVAVKQNTETARMYKAADNETAYSGCKKQSLCITASVLCHDGHSVDNIESYNGYVMADFDHLPTVEAAQELKGTLSQVPHVAAAWVTHSGTGVRLLLRYRLDPLAELLLTERYGRVAFSPDDFKLLRQHLLNPIALVAQHPCDPVTKDPTRLSFVCHDGAAYFDLTPFSEADAMAIDPAVLCPPTPLKEYKAPARGYTDDAGELSLRLLEHRGESYREGNRNNYLFARCCLLCRLGMSQGEAETLALQQGADLPPQEVRALVASAFRRCGGEAGDLRRLLQLQKRRKAKDPTRGKESTRSDLAAIESYLRSHYLFRFNCLTRCVEFALCPSLPADAAEGTPLPPPEWHDLDDRTLSSLWREVCDLLGKMVNKKHIKDLLESNYSEPYDPLIRFLTDSRDTVQRRYLEERAPQWHKDPLYRDKEGRCVPLPWRRDEDQLRRVFGAVHTTCPDEELYLWAAATWFVSAMATVLYAKDKGQLMLMLVGDPGIGKTRFFAYLWPQDEVLQRYYSCCHPGEVDKDFRLQATEQMFICLDEYSRMSAKNLAALKSLLTSNATTDRAPYAMLKQRRDRCTTFCGTGNDLAFVEDDAMARRMPVFHATAIDNNGDLGDRVDYALLYGQATYLLEHGMCYWMQPGGEREKQLADYEEAFRAVPPEEEFIMRFFFPAHDEGPHYDPVTRALLQPKFYTASEVLFYLNLCGVRLPLNRQAIGRALHRLGYVRRKIHGKNGYYLVARVFSEIDRTAEQEARAVKGM